MTLSQSRNSHERNLEKGLESQAKGTAGHGPSGVAPGTTMSGDADDEAAHVADPDVASRLAREAAEREAIRRASERAGDASEP